MNWGASTINPPNSHPSTPIHKAAMAAQTPKPASKKTPSGEVGEIEEKFSEKTPQHEVNKTTVIIGVVGVAALVIIASR